LPSFVLAKEKNLTIKDIYGQEVIDAFFKTEVLSEF